MSEGTRTLLIATLVASVVIGAVHFALSRLPEHDAKAVKPNPITYPAYTVLLAPNSPATAFCVDSDGTRWQARNTQSGLVCFMADRPTPKGGAE